MSNDERPGVAALVSGFLRFGLGSGWVGLGFKFCSWSFVFYQLLGSGGRNRCLAPGQKAGAAFLGKVLYMYVHFARPDSCTRERAFSKE